MSVFCDLHDVNLPRIAFFANENIKARTELTYDYGYQVRIRPTEPPMHTLTIFTSSLVP